MAQHYPRPHEYDYPPPPRGGYYPYPPPWPPFERPIARGRSSFLEIVMLLLVIITACLVLASYVGVNLTGVVPAPPVPTTRPAAAVPAPAPPIAQPAAPVVQPAAADVVAPLATAAIVVPQGAPRAAPTAVPTAVPPTPIATAIAGGALWQAPTTGAWGPPECNAQNATYRTDKIVVNDPKTTLPLGEVSGWSCVSADDAAHEAQRRAGELVEAAK